jgi:hypothetical protein
MDDRRFRTRPVPALVAVACIAASVLGCGCGAAGTASSPAGLAAGAGAPAASSVPAASPSPTLSAADLGAAKRVVRRLITAVDGDRYALARSLMVAPDRWWSLDDMKAIRSIRLERVTVFRVEAPNAVLLETDLERDPPPIAGGPSAPNFMLLVHDASGTWRVAQTATGP